MATEHARAGQAGRLDSLASAVPLETLGIHGGGAIEIDDGDYPPRVKWRPIRSVKESSNASVCDESQASPGIVDFAGRACKAQKNFESSYRSRIEYLRNEAAHDGYPLNKDSEADFWQFVRFVSGIRRGGLVLMDNGNLRAVWKDSLGSRIGLQFLGDGMAQYVIFGRNGSERQRPRVAGRASLGTVLRQIEAFDLGELFYK